MSRRFMFSIIAVAVLCTAPVTAPTLAAQDSTKRALTPADYGKWESLGFGSEVSPDGKWLAYPVNRVNEEIELRITPLDRDTTIVVHYARNPSFSEDGRWLAYAIGVSPKEQKQLQKARKPIHTELKSL